MSYTNTGYQRATTLTVVVKEDQLVISTNILPLMSAFTQGGTSYPAVNSTQIAQMTTSEYTARVTAYAAYVQENYQSQYPGLVVLTTGSRVLNTTACPIP